MKIGLVTTIPGGGPIEHAIGLARDYVILGHEVTAICSTDDVRARFAATGAETIRVDASSMLAPSALKATRRALVGLDVVHAHDRRAGLWTRLMPRVGALRNVTIVYTVHGIPDPYLPAPVGDARHGARDRFAYEFLDPMLGFRADAIVVPSRHVAEDLCSRLNWPRRRTHVVPNGIDIEGLEFSRARGTLVGTVSRLDRFKGLDVFIRAVALLHREHPQQRFAIVGSGDEERNLKRMSAQLGVDDRITMPGFVPAPDAMRTLSTFVISSHWENAPIALLEALALGVPIVTTSVGGIPEIATPQVATIVPPGSPSALAAGIRSHLADPDGALARAARGRQVVEAKFQARTTAARLLDLYSELRASKGM